MPVQRAFTVNFPAYPFSHLNVDAIRENVIANLRAQHYSIEYLLVSMEVSREGLQHVHVVIVFTHHTRVDRESWADLLFGDGREHDDQFLKKIFIQSFSLQAFGRMVEYAKKEGEYSEWNAKGWAVPKSSTSGIIEEMLRAIDDGADMDMLKSTYRSELSKPYIRKRINLYMGDVVTDHLPKELKFLDGTVHAVGHGKKKNVWLCGVPNTGKTYEIRQWEKDGHICPAMCNPNKNFRVTPRAGFNTLWFEDVSRMDLDHFIRTVDGNLITGQFHEPMTVQPEKLMSVVTSNYTPAEVFGPRDLRKFHARFRTYQYDKVFTGPHSEEDEEESDEESEFVEEVKEVVESDFNPVVLNAFNEAFDEWKEKERETARAEFYFPGEEDAPDVIEDFKRKLITLISAASVGAQFYFNKAAEAIGQ